MSSFRIISDPKYWIIQPTNDTTNEEYDSEPLYLVKCGTYESPEGLQPFEILMRQSILEKVRNSEYTVSLRSNEEHCLVLMDKNNEPVVPILKNIIF